MRRGGEEAVDGLPLRAELVIVEALGLEVGDVGQAAELVARLRQIGPAVAGVERQIVAGLRDQAEARRPELVPPAEIPPPAGRKIVT